MNKILKYTLIGLGVAAVGTTLYFVFRKPKSSDSGEETTETKETEKKEEEAKSSETPAVSDTSSSPSAEIKTSQPSSVKTVAETKTPAATTTATKPAVNTDKLKGYNVQLILTKSKNPNILKGKFISAEKNGTRLLDKNGKLMFTLKKDDIVGNLIGAKLTAKGDYMAYVKMRDGKTTQTLASNLKFA